MPPNAEEWEKDNVSACSLEPQLSAARRASSCNNSIGRTVSFHEVSFCDPVEIVMCDLKEQRTCLKFCFHLGKTLTESLEMLQEAFKEQALSRARVFEWFSRFKKRIWASRINPVLDALQAAGTTKTSQKSAKNSTKTVVTPLTSYRKLQEWVGAQFSAFWLKT